MWTMRYRAPARPVDNVSTRCPPPAPSTTCPQPATIDQRIQNQQPNTLAASSTDQRFARPPLSGLSRLIPRLEKTEHPPWYGSARSPTRHFVRTIWRARGIFDPAKSERNIRLRALSFERAVDFSFESALFKLDDRMEYNETRVIAIGMLGDRVHVLCFTEMTDGIRVISFRKANDREVKWYAQFHTPD